MADIAMLIPELWNSLNACWTRRSLTWWSCLVTKSMATPRQTFRAYV